MAELKQEDVREAVRERYAAAARNVGGCCSGEVFSGALYGDEADGAPDAAGDASPRRGGPTPGAPLPTGETVLDLGSGAGADVLISARRVGDSGRAIGLDMTDEMLEL